MSKPGNGPSDEPEEKPENKQSDETAKQSIPDHSATHWELTSLTRPGFTMFIPHGTPQERWIFDALPYFEGAIVRISDGTDMGWQVLFGAGMPTDLPLVDVIFSAAGYDMKYKDFAIMGRGVFVDPGDRAKGKSQWLWHVTHRKSGAELHAYLWSQRLFFRGSSSQLIAHFTNGTNENYMRLTGRDVGVNYDLIYRPDDHAGADTLRKHDYLLADSRAILEAAVEKRGRKPLAELPPGTLELWSDEYTKTQAALDKETSNRNWRQLKRVTQEPARIAYIKRALRGIPDEVAVQLARKCSRTSEVALRYTAWRCSQITVGVYERGTLQKYLQESDRLNGVVRKRSGQK